MINTTTKSLLLQGIFLGLLSSANNSFGMKPVNSSKIIKKFTSSEKDTSLSDCDFYTHHKGQYCRIKKNATISKSKTITFNKKSTTKYTLNNNTIPIQITEQCYGQLIPESGMFSIQKRYVFNSTYNGYERDNEALSTLISATLPNSELAKLTKDYQSDNEQNKLADICIINRKEPGVVYWVSKDDEAKEIAKEKNKAKKDVTKKLIAEAFSTKSTSKKNQPSQYLTPRNLIGAAALLAAIICLMYKYNVSFSDLNPLKLFKNISPRAT